jgi:hypothetical protein
MSDYAKEHIADHSRVPNADRLNELIGFVRNADEPITKKNFRRWLVELAGEMVPDGGALCPNGKDHACNRGLGEWLGIEPYGQGTDGNVPWDQQTGFASERFNRYANPAWVEALVAADFETQKAMYIKLIESVRDTGQFNYSVERVAVAA